MIIKIFENYNEYYNEINYDKFTELMGNRSNELYRTNCCTLSKTEKNILNNLNLNKYQI